MTEFDENELKPKEEDDILADPLREDGGEAENIEDDDTAEDAAESAETEGSSDAAKPAEEKVNVFADTADWIGTIVYAIVIILALNIFFFRVIAVDGTSMCDTLQDGDNIIAHRILYTPKRGDIVVLQADRLPRNKVENPGGGAYYGESIIKRVIAVEGDTLRFDLSKGEVYLNGELLNEEYISTPTVNNYSGLHWCVSGVDYTVPENCVFVMGDNRKVSWDSRDLDNVGFIDVDSILGKAVAVVTPLERFHVIS